MTLNRPLENLMPADKAMVLTVLERAGEPLSGRRIALLTGTVSQPTTSRLLIELVRRGLVMKVPGGYVFNRDHIASSAVTALLGIRDELTRRVAHELDTWETPALSVVLFGSAARQEDTPDSDIDVLVVRPASLPFDDPRWAVNVANLAERVGRWCGSPCEILEYSIDELAEMKRADDSLIASLLRDGITLAGVSLDSLLATVPA